MAETHEHNGKLSSGPLPGALESVRVTAEKLFDVQAAGEPEDAARSAATDAAKAALDAGHGLAAVAAAEAAGQRAGRDRARPQLLRGVERAAKRLREATADHEAAIVAAARAGLTAREIAGRAQIAHATVGAMVRRHGDGSRPSLTTSDPGEGDGVAAPAATESRAA
jgi:DNA-binding NarL/FixJ family response regulator